MSETGTAGRAETGAVELCVPSRFLANRSPSIAREPANELLAPPSSQSTIPRVTHGNVIGRIEQGG